MSNALKVAAVVLAAVIAAGVAARGGGTAPSPGSPGSSSTVRPVLRLGSEGSSVRRLQSLLGIRSDGRFGPGTRQAVRNFQRARGLRVDGIVGPATWRTLERRG